MALGFGSVTFGVQASNWRFPRPGRTADRPRRIECDVVFDDRTDYNAFLDLFSVVTWRRPLGRRTWVARTQAGHGSDALVTPSSGSGPGSETTHSEAYLTAISAEGDAGRERYFVRATWELP